MDLHAHTGTGKRKGAESAFICWLRAFLSLRLVPLGDRGGRGGEKKKRPRFTLFFLMSEGKKIRATISFSLASSRGWFLVLTFFFLLRNRLGQGCTSVGGEYVLSQPMVFPRAINRSSRRKGEGGRKERRCSFPHAIAKTQIEKKGRQALGEFCSASS